MANYANQDAFWQQHLQSANPLLELPLDLTRPNDRTSLEFGFVPWSVSPQHAAQLRIQSAAANVPVPVFVFCTFQALLARISRQDNVTVGCNPLSLLNPSASEPVKGQQHDTHNDDIPEPSCYSTTISTANDPMQLSPLCSPLDLESESLQSLASRTRAALADLVPHAHTPLKVICEAVRAGRSGSYHPIFQAGFLLTPHHLTFEEATAAAAAVMHPMAASAGGMSASLIRSALCKRGNSFSSSFSAAGVANMGGDVAAPLDLLLVMQGPQFSPAEARQLSTHKPQHGSGPDTVEGVLAFSQDVFDPELMGLLAQHFEVFLSAACTRPKASLASLDMMSPDERRQVLHTFNDSGIPQPLGSGKGLLVHHQFMAQAAVRPNAPCLIYEEEQLTYRQVDEASNHLANHLIHVCGVREGDVVGLMMQRSHNMMISMLAILKAGGAYLPLDAGHPPSRTAFIVIDASLKVIIAQEDLVHLLPEASANLQHVVLPSSSGLGPVVSAASPDSPGFLGHPQDLVYVIYTSGSTGNPKGVMVQHSNLVNFLAWEAATFGYTPADVFLQKTPTNFDVSVEELWVPMATGAALVIAKPNGHKDTAYLLQLINTHGVTNLSMVPSQISMLLVEVEEGLASCTSLKRILSAGEALTTSLARHMARVLPGVDLVNAYGPTEATVYITHHTFNPKELNGRPTVSIGKPLTNSKCYIVDKQKRLCPVGVPGELVVSGPQITRGYLNLPDKTGAVFVANPYCAGPGTSTDVMYHTGDLARWLPGGRIECLGRTDHQVKLRGYRIELQEIESGLVEQPGIQAAVCCIIKDTAGQARLVAYVEPSASTETPDRQALHAALSRRLPTYMIPDLLVVMPALPRLSNEKLNRKALPEPDWTADALSGAAAAATGGSSGPRYSEKQLSADAVLQAVVMAWGKALSLDPFSLGPASDFMGLGGNSLQAGMMAAAVRKALQLPKLSGLLIYTNSQLGSFVAEVKHQAKAAALAGPACTPGGIKASTAQAMGPASSSATGSSVQDADSDQDLATSSVAPAWYRRALPLWLATLVQLLAAAVCSGLQLILSLAPILTVQIVMATMNEWTALAFIPVAKVVTLLGIVLLHICAKWLLIGRYKPGIHPIYSLHYIAWWIDRLLFKAVQALLLPFIRGTALNTLYFRLLGARVSGSAVLDLEDISEYDLVEVQDGAFVGGNTVIAPGSRKAACNKQGAEATYYPYGTFTHSRIVVGKNAVVAGLCVLAGPGASVGDNVVLPPNCSSTDPDALKRGQAIRPEAIRLADKPMGCLPALAALLVLVLFESLMLMPATITVMLLWDHLIGSTGSMQESASAMISCWMVPEMQRTKLQQAQCQEMAFGELISIAAFAPTLLLTNLLMLPLIVAPLKWIMLGKMTGEKLTSSNPLRQWSIFTFVIIQRSFHVRMATMMIQGTEAFNIFLRMIGYKIGRQAWIGNHNISLVTPDMVTIGDTVSMGSDSHFYNATPTAVGPITFSDGVDVGHQTTLFPNTVLMPGSVLGAKSNVMEGEKLPAGAIKLGTALLKGGKDLESGKPDNSSNGLVSSRLVSSWRYAVCNVITLIGNLTLIPFTYTLLTLPLTALVLVAVYEGSGMLVAPAVLLGFALNFILNISWLAFIRRMLVPTSAGVHPFWSSFFVRWNLWTGPFCVATLAFTPYFGSQLIIWLYRALGTRIGKDCCIGGGYSAEPDSFIIGDGCVLETYSAASNHTIERRQLTISHIKLGDGVTLGVYGVLFPDVEVESGAVLDNCSVVLKGERVMAGTKWRGIPAEPVW